MRIGIARNKRRIITIAILVFSLWWFLQSWIAYRHVTPSVKLTREQVVFAIHQQDPKSRTEQEVIVDAWRRGALDMNHYLVKHFWVLVWCLIALAVLAFIPERREKNNEESQP